MADCHRIDPLVTAYVDGEINATDREVVDRHLRLCPPCRGRVHAERAVHALIRARKATLDTQAAPPILRSRCSALGCAKATVGGLTSTWRARLVPFALAASLVLLVGGAFVYELTERSTAVLAAELTADHIKCFRVINPVLGTRQEPKAVEASMQSRFDWPLRLPDGTEQVGLELIGARPCVYGKGFVAHLMYRHHDSPVSIFMLPKSMHGEELIDVMGYQAAIWSVGDRTFVVIAREPKAEVERISEFVQSSIR